ncbi:sprouty-related, EVH1 domain-containing protein 2 [Ostrinia nubilalis]|uniref:sprouty-related, EVH1 domain-containing protein 2 n=1 Tax=Ostrinia nubilalis TaxID=29057 RepID=UPI00308253B4
MTGASENAYLVRVRAQVMCRDEGTGGWVALGGGGLADVMVGRRARHVHRLSETFQRAWSLSAHSRTFTAVLEPSGTLKKLLNSSSSSQQLAAEDNGAYTDRKIKKEAADEDNIDATRVMGISRKEKTKGTGGWVALGGGGLADVMVGRRARHVHRLSGHGRLGGGGLADVMVGRRARHVHRLSAGAENGDTTSTPASAPTHEYYIHGKRISDNMVVLECTIKKDFQYNKVMPTFHHWVTDEKRFGLTFQTAADARAFDKGVRTAIEELLDGLGGAWPSLHAYKKLNPAPKEDDEEQNIFECLNLPSDSRSSSENSTASRRRPDQLTQTPILSAITLPTHPRPDPKVASTSSPRRRYRAQVSPTPTAGLTSPAVASTSSPRRRYCPPLRCPRTRAQLTQTPILSAITLPTHPRPDSLKQYEVQFDDKVGDDSDPDRCPYVHLSAIHDYTYPAVSAAGVISSEKSSPNTKPPLLKRDSGSIKKMRGYTGPPPLPGKKPPDTTFQARIKCRHCHEWYLESANRAGACEYAPDCCKSCVECVSCIKCAQCMLYHCMSDGEGDFMHPCACGPPDDACTKRWIGITLLSLVVPCLWCYLPLRCVHRTARSASLAGGLHAPIN